MKILKNKNYPGIMYVSLLIMSLLILFSMVSILEKSEHGLPEKKITAYAVYEDTGEIKNEVKTTEYSTVNYLTYYGLVSLIFASITIILIRFIYKIKSLGF